MSKLTDTELAASEFDAELLSLSSMPRNGRRCFGRTSSRTWRLRVPTSGP
jgi:hypothetical protein